MKETKDRYAYLKELCNSEADVKHIEEIAMRRRSIMKGQSRREDASASLRPLHLDNLTFYLKSDIAPSSIDTLVEIFRDRSHRRLTGFSRIGAAEGLVAAGGGTLIDLGANEGFYSLAMLRENPQLRIVAAEPHPEVYRVLCANINANNSAHSFAHNGPAQGGGGITPVHTAVTELEGMVELESYPHQSTIASRNIGTMEQSWMDKNRVERTRVPATTLPRLLFDYNIDHVDILKIDVEGDELAVLEGCETAGTPLNSIDRIVIEWHSKELKEKCISFLTSRGFRLLCAEDHRFGEIYFKRNSH
ncbi:MAG: FkbM family methyltransferase [Spirochaetaceae bacterium]